MNLQNPVTEAERNELEDRNMIRRAIQREAQTLIDATLNTPASKKLYLSPLLIMFEASVRATIEKFRERNEQRYLAQGNATGIPPK